LRVETVRAKAKKAKPARERKTGASRTTPRLRIVMGEGLILGPGKVDLIEAIERKGSISAASREMGMSYRRAWLLVDALNSMFGRPIDRQSLPAHRAAHARRHSRGARAVLSRPRFEVTAHSLVMATSLSSA
jgi:molybdate transport system regulatory protein